jgi:hypothetical protein
MSLAPRKWKFRIRHMLEAIARCRNFTDGGWHGHGFVAMSSIEPEPGHEAVAMPPSRWENRPACAHRGR